jgi:hypothetical protein
MVETRSNQDTMALSSSHRKMSTHEPDTVMTHTQVCLEYGFLEVNNIPGFFGDGEPDNYLPLVVSDGDDHDGLTSYMWDCYKIDRHASAAQDYSLTV